MTWKLEDLKEKYTSAKLVVKKWEDAFKKENGEKPNKDALSSAPADIKGAYKLYWKLAKELSALTKKKIPSDNVKTMSSVSSISVSNESCQENVESAAKYLQNVAYREQECNDVKSPVALTNSAVKVIENCDNFKKVAFDQKGIWGSHLNKNNSSTCDSKDTEFSLYTKMALNMKSHAVVKTRTSLKRLPSKNSLDSETKIKENNLSINFSTENLSENSYSKENPFKPFDESNTLHNTLEIDDITSFQKLELKNCVIKKIDTKCQSVSHLSINRNTYTEKISRNLNKNWVDRCTLFNDNLSVSNISADDSSLKDDEHSSINPDPSFMKNVSNLDCDNHNISNLNCNDNSLKINLQTSDSLNFQNDNSLDNSENASNKFSNNNVVLNQLNSDKGQNSLGIVSDFEKDLCVETQSLKEPVECCSLNSKQNFSVPNKRKINSADFKNTKRLKRSDDCDSKAFDDDEKYNEQDEEWKPNSRNKSKLSKKSEQCKIKIRAKRTTKSNKSTPEILNKKKVTRQTVESKNEMDSNGKDEDTFSKDQHSDIVEYDELCEITNNKQAGTAPRRKYLTSEQRLNNKIKTGKLNENFVKINLKKKVFVRGKRRMTGEKYKRIEWNKKQIMKKAEGGDERSIKKLTCFRCGDFGHWATKCPGKIGDSLLPADSYNEAESTYLTIEEATNLARGIDSSSNDKITRIYSVDSNNIPDNNKEENESDDLFSDWEDDVLPAIESMEKPPDRNANNNESVLSSVKSLYPLNPDGSIIDTPDEVLKTLELFGHNSFRKGQEEAIMRILSGQSTLVVQSTGSGKSLCYQLPAYLYAKHFKCITLCVSPLVSLMEDQVTGLPSFLKAVCLHTQQSSTNKEKALTALRSGNVHILLVSPEAVVSSSGGGVLGALLKELPPISFACLDEAHCLSEWSHNFRPSYLQVCQILKDRLRVNTFLGLTATARNETAASIARHLQIPSLNKGVIMGTCIPDNLMLTVSRDKNREEALIHLLTGERLNDCSSIIIYCTRREECERIAVFIRTQMLTASQIDVKSNAKRQRGISLDAEAYHAGLSGYRRQQIQKRFMSGKLRIVVATVAFGMGIDKADVQGIIHFNMPRNLESYVQEIGRAGRDGNLAHCHLFLDSSDGKDIQELKRHIFVNSVDRFVVRKLLNKVFVPGNCVKANKLLESSEVSCNNSDFNDESNSNKTSLYGENLCPGHEVGLPIEDLIEALDLPEENIQTLLCYLENHSKCRLKLSHHAYATCKVSCYRGPKQLCSVSKKCPPLAVAIALQRKKKDNFSQVSSISFPVIEISSQMGWQSRIVKQELKNLEWDRTGISYKPSGVKVEFCDLAFHMNCRCDLTEEDQDKILEDIYDRACTQEKDQLKKLQYTYEVLRESSNPSVSFCCDTVDEEKSVLLKEKIREYFSTCNEKGLGSINLEEQLYIRPEIEQRVRSDIRALISIHSDHSWTGRAVARILHGISSPNYPSKVWGRVRRFWRQHLEIDFNLLVSIATKEILNFR